MDVGEKMAEERLESQVFILYSSSLLAEGLEGLLRQEGLHVNGVDLRQPEALPRAKRRLRPHDVVIFDTGDSGVHPPSSILELLLQGPEIALIGLDPCLNRVAIYRKMETSMSRPEELVKTILAL